MEAAQFIFPVFRSPPWRRSELEEQYFTPELFKFLRDLRKNNNREWFQANKQRYEQNVQGPALHFIKDLAPHLHMVSPYLVADPKPMGGSLFRIYRDIRFSKDKTPYKTHVAAHFSHKDAKMEWFGYYLHLEPGSSSGGGGLWHPGTPALTMVRKNIAGNPERWKEARNGIKIQGESLKRPPQGYNPEHPFIKDLKRKDLYAMFPIPEQTVCSTTFPAKFAEQCAKITPLMSFLAKSTALPW